MKRRGHFHRLFPIGCGLVVLLLLAGAASSSHSSRRTATLAGHTSTLLSDGRWLFVGGSGSTGPVATATLWDSQSGALTPTRQAPHWARAWHTATVLPDGAVLLFGGLGVDGAVISTAELFFPDTQSFTPLFTGSLTPRAFHSATLLTDGRVLIAGGRATTDEVLPTAELWNPRALTSEVVSGSMHTARERHSATLLSDGAVLLSGGRNPNGVELEDAELYTPASQTFTQGDEYRTGSVSLPPLVAASVPESGATEIPLDALLSVRLSVPAWVETVTTATVMFSGPRGMEDVVVTAAEGGRLVFVTPSTLLAPGAVYTLTLDGIRDAAGNALPLSDISFTTTTAIPVPPLSAGRRDATNLKPNRDSGEVEERAAQESKAVAAHTDNTQTQASAQLAPLLEAPPGVTALSGRVLRLNGKPLARVTLEIEEHRTQTDAHGRFLLTNIPAGQHELLIDGRSANRPRVTYGVFEAGVEITGGTTNVLPYTIWMPKIDTAHAVTIPSPTTQEVVVTTPKIPGLEFHLPPGAVVKDHDGHIVTEISITPIPLDQPPHPLPVNVKVPVYFTIQPGGAYIVGAEPYATNPPGGAYTAGAEHYTPKGGWLVYPNTVGEAPGARFSFWQYDPEGIGWQVYGLGTVTPDGQQSVPDPDVRLYEFTGAMINGGGSPGGSPEPEPCDECCLHFDGDPVCAATGVFLYTHTDLVLPGVLPIALTRTYRTHDLNLRPFGIGTTHPYELFLWSANQYQETDLILPDGARVHYVRISPGTSAASAVFEHTASPTAFYKSRIAWNGQGWDLTLKDGTVYVFGENAPLQYIRDRYGNTIVLTRQSTNLYGSQTGNILQITASNGRWLAFTYDASNRITQATDHTGRSVTYTYNASGHLWW